MKKYFFCALALFLGTANAQENSTDDMKWLNLKGPVKTMESTTLSVKTGEKTHDWEDGIFKFHSSGKISEQTRYKKSGEMDYIETTAFSDDGNAVSSVRTNSSGAVVENSSYSYDGKKNLTGKTSVKPNGDKAMELSLSYDANGNLVKKIIHTYENGKPVFEETTKFTYHPGTSVIKSELHEGKVWDYDHPEKNKLFSTTLNKNAAGNKTDETTATTTTADNKTETVKKTYTYHPTQNKVSQEKAFIKDNLVGVRDFSYDDHGNLTSEQKIHHPGKEVDKITRSYEYDERSNWIKSIVTIEENGKEPDGVKIVRTITYF